MEEKIENSEKTEIKLINRLCKKVRNNLFKTLLIGSGLLASGIGINQRIEKNDNQGKDTEYIHNNINYGYSENSENMEWSLGIIKERANSTLEINDLKSAEEEENIKLFFEDLFSFDVEISKKNIKMEEIILKIFNDADSVENKDLDDYLDLISLIKDMYVQNKQNDSILNIKLQESISYGKPVKLTVSASASDEYSGANLGVKDSQNVDLARNRQAFMIGELNQMLTHYEYPDGLVEKGNAEENVLDSLSVDRLQKIAMKYNLSLKELLVKYNRSELSIDQEDQEVLDKMIKENRYIEVKISYEKGHIEKSKLKIPYLLFLLLLLIKGKKPSNLSL